MKKIRSLIISFLVLLLVSCATSGKTGKQSTNKSGDANSSEKNNFEGIAERNNAFAFALFSRLEEKDENLFFSPYSITSALAMTYEGAAGKTADEMSEVMRFISNKKENSIGFQQLNSSLEHAKGDNTELNIANAVWLQKDFDILPGYLQNVENYFDAPVKKLSFLNEEAIENSRQEINNWIANETRDKIKDLIQPGVLSQLTRMILTNAIYFKAGWQHPFSAAETEKGPFYTYNQEETTCDFMHQTGRFRYFADENFQIAEMPYDNGNYSMAIILPARDKSTSIISKNINSKLLDSLLKSATSKRVKLIIPKFKLTSTLQPGQTLSGMGMQQAFSKDADFSGINGKKNLYIDAIVHKAFVGVEEKGTEAAASTAVVMSLKSAMTEEPEPVTFKADHPFLFVIRERSTGCIIFMGKLSDPS
ncbi:MAG TPA: serpin family protein [Bacteroidales bacterium]|nr:serpin family protein [Bacteroidales bacterium]